MLHRPAEELLAEYHVLIEADSPAQASMRLMQSLWRDEMGWPAGEHRGAPLGSRIVMPDARDNLANYMTPQVRDLVREEVEGPKATGKLYSKPRIYDNLLSSQPLCFNLFGELALDLSLATTVCRTLWPNDVEEVTSVEFEWSPGRNDERYLGNRSAFDVIIFHTSLDGGDGFVGIEVKYHENMSVAAATHKPLYDELAARSAERGGTSRSASRGPDRPPTRSPSHSCRRCDWQQLLGRARRRRPDLPKLRVVLHRRVHSHRRPGKSMGSIHAGHG